MLTGSQLGGSASNSHTRACVHPHTCISREYAARGPVQDDPQGIDLLQAAPVCNALIAHVRLHKSPLVGTEVEQGHEFVIFHLV